jgi:hypothetical protein
MENVFLEHFYQDALSQELMFVTFAYILELQLHLLIIWPSMHLSLVSPQSATTSSSSNIFFCWKFLQVVAIAIFFTLSMLYMFVVLFVGSVVLKNVMIGLYSALVSHSKLINIWVCKRLP